jgi:thiol:disulfide interchange protein DsbD
MTKRTSTAGIRVAAFAVAWASAAAITPGVGAQPASKPGLPGIAPPTGDSDKADGNTLITPSLIAERTALVPGQDNWIAVRFEIAPKWHTYWRNAGESGVPATFAFTAPEWLTIGEPVWPTPIRYPLPSGGVDYVYEGTALVLFPVRVDDTTREIKGEAQISVAIDWLVCQDVCLPGSTKVSLSIPLYRDASPSDDAEAFAAARARLPRPRDAASGVDASFATDTLTISAPGAAEIEFFPYESDSLATPANPLAQGISRSGTLRFAYDRTPTDTDAITGVARIRDAAGADRFFDIRVPVESPADD